MVRSTRSESYGSPVRMDRAVALAILMYGSSGTRVSRRITDNVLPPAKVKVCMYSALNVHSHLLYSLLGHLLD
jgi:hypothetical protein